MTSNVKVCILFSLVGMMTGFGSAYISASGTVMAQDKGHEDIIRFMKDSGGRHIDGEHRSGQKDIFQKKRELSHSDKIARLCERLMKRMEAEDYEELLQDILDDSDESYKNLALQFLMRKWVKTAPRHALRQAEEKGGGFEALFNEWAAYDLKSYIEFANELGDQIPESYAEGLFTEEIMGLLVEESPDEAIQIFRRSGDNMSHFLGYVFMNKVATLYPERIKDFIEEMEIHIRMQTQGGIPGHMLDEWYKSDSDGLKAWASSDYFDEEEYLREQINDYIQRKENENPLNKEDVLLAINNIDFDLIGELGFKDLESLGLSFKEIINYYGSIFMVNPPVFKEFKGESVDDHFSEVKPYFMDPAAYSLIYNHREEVKEVLFDLPEGERKDMLIENLVRMDLSDNHEWKVSILQQIGDKFNRGRNISQYLGKWEKIDKQGADAWRKKHLNR